MLNKLRKSHVFRFKFHFASYSQHLTDKGSSSHVNMIYTDSNMNQSAHETKKSLFSEIACGRDYNP